MRRLGGGIPGMTGVPGMFGGGMPMGALPPKKKKSTTEKRPEETEEYSMPQQRVPMFGMPGMIPVRSPEPEDRALSVEKEDENPHPVTSTRPAHEVPDVEEVASQPVQPTSTDDGPPPVPTDRKFLIPRKPIYAFVRHAEGCLQLPSSETLSKTYVTYDGLSEYVMTVCVSSMCVHWALSTICNSIGMILTISRTSCSSSGAISV
jgi:hypothetical protein